MGAFYLLFWLAGTGGGAFLAWRTYGWMPAVAWLTWSVAAYVIGHGITLWDIRTDGYVLEKKRDMRGKTRWRVGTPAPPPERTPEPRVTWVPPGEVGRMQRIAEGDSKPPAKKARR